MFILFIRHTTNFKFKIINKVIRINVHNNFVIYNNTYKHYSDDFYSWGQRASICSWNA